jgi:hypothetical protein
MEVSTAKANAKEGDRRQELQEFRSCRIFFEAVPR